MRPHTLVLGASFLLVLLVAPPSALACTVTESATTATIHDPWGGTFYVVVLGGCGPRCPFAEYIYEETNSYGGLQRHDGFADNVCGVAALADMEIL